MGEGAEQNLCHYCPNLSKVSLHKPGFNSHITSCVFLSFPYCAIGHVAVGYQMASCPHSPAAGHCSEATADDQYEHQKDPREGGDSKRILEGCLVAVVGFSWCVAGRIDRVNPAGACREQTAQHWHQFQFHVWVESTSNCNHEKLLSR